MGGWLGDSLYTELHRETAQAAERADQELAKYLVPDYARRQAWQYEMPNNRWGQMVVHHMGPKKLAETLAEMNIQGSQALIGDVLGGKVQMYVLSAPRADGGPGNGTSQYGRGHEQTHVDDQLAAIWDAYQKGGNDAAMRAAQAARVYDADNQGERIGAGKMRDSGGLFQWR